MTFFSACNCTREPTSDKQDVNEKSVLEAFLPALSVEERQCVEASFSQDSLRELIQEQLDQMSGSKDSPPKRIEDLQACMDYNRFMMVVMGAVADCLPEIPAPGDLGTVRLPNDRSNIVALLERFPSQIEGEARSLRLDDLYRPGVHYGTRATTLSIEALDVSSGDFFPPEWTASEVIAIMSLGADWEVIASGQEGTLLWVCCISTGITPEEKYLTYATQWGDSKSRWVYVASAPTPADVDTLVAAFVTAANTK
jgi:hypothetical protein